MKPENCNPITTGTPGESGREMKGVGEPGERARAAKEKERLCVYLFVCLFLHLGLHPTVQLCILGKLLISPVSPLFSSLQRLLDLLLNR